MPLPTPIFGLRAAAIVACAGCCLALVGASSPGQALDLTLENGFEPAAGDPDIPCTSTVAARIEDPVDGDIVIYGICNGFYAERGDAAFLMTYDDWYALPRRFADREVLQMCEGDDEWGIVRLAESDGTDVVMHHNCVYMLSFE